MVLTGTDFLAAGIEQGVLMKVLPAHAAKFPNLMANYQPAAAKMQELAGDYGVAVVFMPAGPLIEYNPDKVKQAADNAAGTARVVQGQSEQADLRAARKLGPGAPSSWACRTFSATRIRRSGERLGQDLGVSEGLTPASSTTRPEPAP
jgi:hypothetical protein